MNKKIEWFQEVLSLEPGSRVFFPLAKMFVQSGDYEAAVQTLRKGLDRHPDFLEARFLLVDILVRLGLRGEAREHMVHITGPLTENPAFWKLWAQSFRETKPDLAVFLMLVASNLSGKEMLWPDMVREGLDGLLARLVGDPESDAGVEAASEGAVPPESLPMGTRPEESRLSAAVAAAAPEAGESQEAGRSSQGGGAIRTRTMADLLATQGDYAGARDIYAELLAGAVAEEDKRVLSGRVAAMEAKVAEEPQEVSPPWGQSSEDDGREDVLGGYAKERLITTLEALAARFEARH